MPQGLPSAKLARLQAAHAGQSDNDATATAAAAPEPEPRRKTYSILIVNPNSTKAMTDALEPLVEPLLPPDATATYFTAPPTAPPSINDLATSAQSASACLPLLLPLLPQHAGVIIACYSAHPLIAQLRARTPKPVVGIFEAATVHALQLLRPGEKFGVVTTGSEWKPLLNAAVNELLGSASASSASSSSSSSSPSSSSSSSTPTGATSASSPAPENSRFAGIGSTGLYASELHAASADELERRMADATKQVLAGPHGGDMVRVLCLGCAGMVGTDAVVRRAAREVGRRVRVVDGVAAAVGEVLALARCGYGEEDGWEGEA